MAAGLLVTVKNHKIFIWLTFCLRVDAYYIDACGINMNFKEIITGTFIWLCLYSGGFAQARLPVGSTMEHVKGSGSGNVVTPDGKKIKVKLSAYDQWWLAKTEAEQAAWVDFWTESGEGMLKTLNSKMTFVQFMSTVMEHRLTLQDFILANPGNASSPASLPAYAIEIARRRCSNYRSGMGFDEGREQAAKGMSLEGSRAIARQITFGNPQSPPNDVGMMILAINVAKAIDEECRAAAEAAMRKQVVGRGWANTSINSIDFGKEGVVYLLERAAIVDRDERNELVKMKTCTIILSLEEHKCIDSGEVHAWCGKNKILMNLLTGAISRRVGITHGDKGLWDGSNPIMSPGEQVGPNQDPRRDGLLRYACDGKTLGALGGINGDLGVGF